MLTTNINIVKYRDVDGKNEINISIKCNIKIGITKNGKEF